MAATSRAAEDLFATKLQFWQFDRFLHNRHGAALFDGACVVHLFRPDVARQVTSYRKAVITGHWDYSARPFSGPSPDGPNEALNALNMVIAEDAGFRRLFAMLGINPLFFTFDDIGQRPREAIGAIARAVGMPVNGPGLDAALATSAPYPQYDDAAPAAFDDVFRALAFRRPGHC